MGTTSKPKKAAGLEPQLPEKTEQSLQEVQAGKKIPSGSSRADVESTPRKPASVGNRDLEQQGSLAQLTLGDVTAALPVQ